MDKPVLFVGQCKQGSNSLFSILAKTPGLCAGKDIRAMVCSDFSNTEYFNNWDGLDTQDCRYLLDKSIINPIRYDYKVGSWQNYQHKMIYMFRDIRSVLRSQFLVVLAGEASYQHCIPANAKVWDIDENSSESDILNVLEYNEQKFTHFENIQSLPNDVFDPNRNMFFCTFEDFKADTTKELARLSRFIGVEITVSDYPHLNKTAADWYQGNTEKYDTYQKVFNKFSDVIYNKYIDISKYERLCDITGIDLIEKYKL